MNKNISLLILVVLPVLLFSCKKCYECEKPQYCLSCVGTISGNTIPTNNCFGTAEERTTTRQTIEAGYEFAGGKVYCLETQNSEGSVEFCENKKNTDAELQQWEALGYTCSEK